MKVIVLNYEIISFFYIKFKPLIRFFIVKLKNDVLRLEFYKKSLSF